LNSDIEVGQFSVSFVATLTALLVLLFGNVLIRRLTVMLDVRLGQRAHMGSGERASIITLVNYTGMVVAILLALGILGIGWTQVAIIAGALSVGIGFGLQGIVNNFVSGLILLFERPVKVGDWIVVQSGEGYVRHIGARATEIETFDRSSIIIPNAEMITGAVENWFYKTRRGRIRLKVGVSYDSDPEQVRKILLECAASQRNVVNYPYAPRVRWLEFGDSSLEFELVAFIVDIDYGATTRSDLHFAIFKALKDVGITIPFPQRDLHIISGEAPADPPDIPDEPPHN
jgi:potassium efflux system protein